MTSVSQILRQTRENKGILLDEVARRTYIKLPYLRALEEGHLDELPAMVFVHGYIRQYAKLLGLNATELVHLFQQEVHHEAPPLVLAPARMMADNEADSSGQAGAANGRGYSNGTGFPAAQQPDGDELASEAISRVELSTERRIPAIRESLERTIPLTYEPAEPHANGSSNEDVKQALQQAQRIVDQAQQEAAMLRREAERYAQQVLSELEAEIGRALAIVRNGRQFIQQRRKTTGSSSSPSFDVRSRT